MSDDRLLLAEFARTRSENAFRSIVDRHLKLVYSAALRIVNGDTHLAEDISQLVFTNLASKAATIPTDSVLAGWLHQDTRFTALEILRKDRRRTAREKLAVTMNELDDSNFDSDWNQLRPVLDGLLCELTEPDRTALLLRFFEEQSLAQVGAALGIEEDAARKRVSRALDRLKDLISKRGIVLNSTALAALLSTRTVSAVPVALADSIARTALTAGTVSSAALAVAFFKWLSAPLTKVAVGLVVAILSAVVIVHQSHSIRIAEPQRPTSAASRKPTQSPTRASGETNEGPISTIKIATVEGPQLMLNIVADDSGRPIPNVPLDGELWDGPDLGAMQAHRFKIVSDRLGNSLVPLTETNITQLRLTTRVEGFADTRLQWRAEKIPATHVLRLIRGVKIGGRVVNPENQPVANASITVRANTASTPLGEELQRELHVAGAVAHTDADGNWNMQRIAPKLLIRTRVAAYHPTLVDASVDLGTPATEEAMLNSTHIFRLAHTVEFRGKLIDNNNQPVVGARIRLESRQLGAGRTAWATSDAGGEFAVQNCKPGKNAIIIEALGFSAFEAEVDAAKDAEPLQVKLQKSGNPFLIHVVDRNGHGIPNAKVSSKDSRGRFADPLTFDNRPFQSDTNGWIVAGNAPDRELNLTLSAPGFMLTEGVRIRPDGQPHEVILAPALVIHGTVRDAESGKPIPRFHLVSGWSIPSKNGDFSTHWSDIDRFRFSFQNGEFRLSFEEPAIRSASTSHFIFKFITDEYGPFVTRNIRLDEGDVRLDVLLRRPVTNSITVVAPDGTPAANAEIGLNSPGDRLLLMPGRFSSISVASGGARVAHTDSQGRVLVPFDDAVTSVVAVSPRGTAYATFNSIRANPIMKLQPWGRVEGTHFLNGRPVSGESLGFQSANTMIGPVAFDSNGFRTSTDADGHFVFEKIPVGLNRLVIVPNLAGVSSKVLLNWTGTAVADVEVEPNKTTLAVIGSKIRQLRFRLISPDGIAVKQDLRVFGRLTGTIPTFRSNDAVNQPSAEIEANPANSAADDAKLHYWAQREPDDTFTIRNVPPGRYLFFAMAFPASFAQQQVSVFSGPTIRLEPPSTPIIGQISIPVTIPSGPQDETVDLGEFSWVPGKSPTN